MSTNDNSTRVYREDGPCSFYIDVARASLSEGNLAPTVVAKAEARLMAHAEEVRDEIRRGTEEGRAALRQIAERHRTGDLVENLRTLEKLEKRAASDTTVVGFSTPQYIENLWLHYRSPASAFADAARSLPLPPVGLAVHIPSFTSSTPYAQQVTENAGIDQDSPSGAYVNDPINIQTFSGSIIASQQLLDRGGFEGQGGTFDVIAATQLADQAMATWDTYVINQATATATTVTQASALTVPLLLANISSGRENMANAPGYYGRATHIWGTQNFESWLSKQVDSQNRPIMLPDASSLIATSVAGTPVVTNTFTGRWIEQQSIWTDDNIPLVSSNQQVLLADMREVFTWKGSPMIVCYPETQANSLSVVIRSHFYGASTPRYTSAVQQLTGAGYASLS